MPGIGIGLSLGLGGGGAGGLSADRSTYFSSVAAGALIATLGDPYGSGSAFSVVGAAPDTLALASGGRIVAGNGAHAVGQASTIVIRAARDGRAIEEPLTFTAVAAPTPTPLDLSLFGMDWVPALVGVVRSGPGVFAPTKEAAQLRAEMGAISRDFIIDNVNGTNVTTATEASPARGLAALMPTINTTAGDVLRVRIKPRASRMVWGGLGFNGTGWNPDAGAARKLIVEAFDGGELIFVKSAATAPPTWTANPNGTYTAPTGITGAANTSAPMDWLPATRDADGVGRVFTAGSATLATDASPAAGTYFHDTSANTVTVNGFDARNLVGDEWVTPVSAGSNIAFNFTAAQTASWTLFLGRCRPSGGGPLHGVNLQAAPGLYGTVIMDRCGGTASATGTNALNTVGALDLYTFDNVYGYNHRDTENAHANASGAARHFYVRTKSRRRTGYSGTGDDNQTTGHGGTSAAGGTRTISVMPDSGPSDGRVVGAVAYARIAVFGSVGSIGPSLNAGARGSTVSASDNARVMLIEASLAASALGTFNVDPSASIACFGMDIAGRGKTGDGALTSSPMP